MESSLLDLMLEVASNPHSWGGVIVGATGVYTGIARGWIATPIQHRLAADLAAEKQKVDALEGRIAALEKEILPYRQWVKKLTETAMEA